MERFELIQQLYQFDTKIQHENAPREITKMIPSTSRKVLPQQVEISEIFFIKPVAFIVITENQKRAFNTDALSSTENLIYKSTKFQPFEKHCIDIFSIPLIREHSDSYFFIFMI